MRRRAVERANPAEAAQDVRHVAAKHAPVGMQLVDDDARAAAGRAYAEPLPLLPRLRPVTLARLWLLCTFLLARLLLSPTPLTLKVSPLTPVAVR